jgi:hypothetical protein
MLFIVVMEELDAISAAALAPDVNIEGDKPGAEVKDRDVRTTPREMTVARFVYDTFLANERFAVEKGFHDQMRESWRICRSEPDSKERAKLAQLGLPGDITDSTTEVRRFAALSQLKEIFASSGQFPCKLSSTSSPDVPEFVTAQALQVMIDELTAVIAEAGAVPDDAAVAQFGRDRMKELLNTAKEHANDEIELLERRVRDDFEEANFLDAFNLGMEYLTTYGSALWEGPVPCVRWKNEFGGSDGTKIFRKAQASVAFRAVNPLDVYPSPDQTNVEDGPICIKIRIAPQELWLNAKEAKGASAEKDGVWFTDTVSDLLAKYPTGGVRLSWQDGDEQNRMLRGQSCWTADASCMMEGISYYGQLKGNLLLRMGVTKSHDGTKIDPGDYYEVNAIVIDDYCVYCRIINPCMGRPLCKAQFYDSPDNFFGNSIAQRLIAYQRILNACLPALVVNMNMTCAPIAWVSDASRLLDKTPNALKLQGGKVIAFKGQVAGVSVQSGPPMGTLRIDSQVDQILGVMKAVLQRVEDVSGIPSYTYGQNVTGGAGRALADYERVLTPNGPKRICDFKIGDEVFNTLSGISKVIGVFPQGERDIYRITFSNGEKVDCDLEHRWMVSDHPDRNNSWKVLTTGELLKRGLNRKTKKGCRNPKGYRPKWALPYVNALMYPEREVPIDPYTMGVLLGNGDARCRVTGMDDEVFERIPYKLGKVERKKDDKAYTRAVMGVRSKYRSLGLCCKSIEKFIPETYLHNSEKVRLELLRGLMDTDGCAASNGDHTFFDTASEKLCDDFVFLVKSLGASSISVRASENKTEFNGRILNGKTIYRINFTLDKPIFHLKRKQDRVHPRPRRRLYITGIEFIKRDSATCISVDAPNHLYICENFIPTHNTYSGLAMLTEAANRVMKMIIDGLDRGVIRRLVKMTAYFHMMYDDKVAYTGDVEVVPTGVMGLILKQQEMQKVLQLMQMVANNQALVQLVGGRGLMELFRQVLETYDIANIDKIIPSKKELDLREFVALAQKNAGGAEFQTAPQGVQSNAQPGQMRPPQNLGDEYAGNGGGQQETYMRNDTEYSMPQEPNPGSAGERRGAA